jgi:hypothetical protein
MAMVGCWKLKVLVIPQNCREVDVSYSGISALDVRGSEAESVRAFDCYHMRTLCLPNRMACELEASSNPALVHVSLRVWPRGNAWQWARSTRPEEMRLFSMRAAPVTDGAGAYCLSGAQIFADVGSVGERQSRPALPC